MNSLIVSLGFMLVASSNAIEPYFLNMAGRGMGPMSGNFINSPLAAEMLDERERERPSAGPGRQDWGPNRRYDSQPRYAQRDWRSQYPSEIEVSLPEKPLSNFDTNQMAPTFDNSFRPSQSNINQILPGPDNSFRVQQLARDFNQFGSSVDDFFRSQQSAPGIGTSPLFGDLFRPQQLSSGISTNRVIPGFDGLFASQQLTSGMATNPLLGFGDLFRPQQSAPGTATDPGTSSLGDLFRPKQSATGTATDPGTASLGDLFRPKQSAPGTATDPGTSSLGDLFRPQQLTSDRKKAVPILTNAIRSLLASPNSDVNKMLSLLGSPLMTPPFTAKTQDFGPKADLLNSPQAVPRSSPSGGFPRLSFLGGVMTLGALDLIDLA